MVSDSGRNMQDKTVHGSSYRPFVIVSLARTGSTYLESLLTSHPNILSFREIYGVHSRYPGYRGLVYLNTLLHKPNLRHLFRVILHKNFRILRAMLFEMPVQDFLSSLLYGSYPTGIESVGFKYHLYHGNRIPELKEYLRRHREIKIVHLRRKNYLHMLVSEKLAQASNQWELKDKAADKAHQIRIRLEKEECEETFFQYERQEEGAESQFAGHDTFVLNYEDLVQNQEETLDRVQEFLGVERRRLSSPLKRQRTRQLSEVIENYDSLKQAFKGSRWSVFLDE